MALTRDIKETIKARADRDPEFRQALKDEASQLSQAGDVVTAQTIRAKLIEAENSGFTDQSPDEILAEFKADLANRCR